MIQPRLFGQPQTELTSDDYYTPRWVFDTLGLRFDLDVASPPGGPPFVPCDRYYTQQDDGLAQSWNGLVWMNPPFSETGRWMDRWLEHGNGVALIPFSRARWLSDVWESGAVLVHPRPRDGMFRFVRDGRLTNIYMPVVLAALGDGIVDTLSDLGRVR